MNLPMLPNIANARLPQTYEQAKAALAKCAAIDECKDWADKAEAMASYARQSGDKQMRIMADKIQGRAIDRCGELYRQIPKAQGGDRSKNLPGQMFASPREQARIKAEMSKNQAADALAVNAIPRDQFEALIESDNPPTVKKLAAIGRKKRKRALVDLGERTAKEFAAATGLIGVIDEFVKEASAIDAFPALRGCDKSELKRLSTSIERATKWLKDFSRIMRGTKWHIRATISETKSIKSSKRR